VFDVSVVAFSLAGGSLGLSGTPSVAMDHPSYRRSSLPFLGLLLALVTPVVARAQEIPLEKCDALPGIAVKVSGHTRWFLVDTAATSMLNLESFAEGSPQDIRVTSWRGTLVTTAKEVSIEGLEVRRTKVVKLTLPAIDLSAIGKACGRKIDGILGADLLGKIAATVDLKRQILHVTTAEEVREAKLASEMQRDTERCTKAFNESDEETFRDCLDPKIIMFNAKEELYGREKVAGYFLERYFHKGYPSRLEIQESAFHAVGEALWYEYEFTIDMEKGRLNGRGMSMCKKTDGHWRMASMHHSEVQFEPTMASEDNR
jgi:hypothetical protein